MISKLISRILLAKVGNADFATAAVSSDHAASPASVEDAVSGQEKRAVAAPSSPDSRRILSIGASWFKGWGATIEKPNNDVLVAPDGSLISRRNEDRFLLRLSAVGDVIAGVADGAGAAGLYCGEWADELLRRVPDEPITAGPGLSEWLDGFWEKFREDFETKAKRDPSLHRKFLREGSYSTLSTIWLRRADSGATMSALLYGDSPVFRCRYAHGATQFELLHPEAISGSLRDPHLLNWRSEPDASRARVLTNIALSPRDAVIIASDGIGQYFLLRCLCAEQLDQDAPTTSERYAELREACRNPDSKVAKWAAALQACDPHAFAEEAALILGGFGDVESFAQYVHDRFERSMLPNDDCTLVVVTVEPPTDP